MRLIQEVFKGHYSQQLRNERFIKRKLLTMQCSIYLVFVLFFIEQDLFLYNPYVLMLSNGSLWLPQIYRNYKRNIRNHSPHMTFYLCMTFSQIYLIMYIYGCPKSFIQKETNYVFLFIFLAYLAVQLIVLHFQAKWGPRFFVPLSLRRDPNAYNYFFKFSIQDRRGPNDPERAEY